jgi:hypothetical protein
MTFLRSYPKDMRRDLLLLPPIRLSNPGGYCSVNRIMFRVVSGINKSWKSKPVKEIKEITQNT